jgi:hypothetical protein
MQPGAYGGSGWDEGPDLRGRTADPFAALERLTVADALIVSPASICWRPPGGSRTHGGLRAQPGAGIRIGDDDRWGDIFNQVLVREDRRQSRHQRATIIDRLGCIEQPWQGRQRTAAWQTLRALCLWGRARQRLWRMTDPVGSDGGSRLKWRRRAHLRRALSARRGFSCRALGDAQACDPLGS